MDEEYGLELVIDASGCNPERFTRENIEAFMIELCDRIDMERAWDVEKEDYLVPYFWDEINGGSTPEPHLKGVSCVQFIETSNIVIHTLSMLHVAFLNIFSCKKFEQEDVEECIKDFFEAKIIKSTLLERRYVKTA